MKSIRKTNSVIIIILIFTVTSCNPTYKFEQLRSIDSSNIVTKIEHDPFWGDRGTYFTIGNHQKKNIPETFVKPIYSGFTSGFELIVSWENDSCYFYYYTGKFEVKDPYSLLKVEKISCEEFIKLENDSTGKYIYQIEKNLFD